ncbi:MAG: ABC transporter permease, partial [Bacteroidales bacterium]|nr:ABC transporter permease [Bacteroidales bacterium]
MNIRFRNMLQRNKEAWKDLFHIIGKELYNIFTDKGVLLVFIVACVVYPLVCGYIYNKELMYDMPIAVVDNSNSTLSRNYLRSVDATPEVKIEHWCSSLQEAKDLQKQSKVHGIVFIPSDFSQNINREEQATISVYNDMTSFFWYRNMALATNFTVQEMGKEIQVQRMVEGGKNIEDAKRLSEPFEAVQHVLYNPGGYPSFILPIVLILILQQTLLIGIGMLAGTATERHQLHTLIPRDAHYRGLLRIIFGRGLAFFITYIPITVYMLVVVPKIFNLPQLMPSISSIFLFITPFLLSVIFLGMSISVFFKNRENSIPFYLFMSLPFVFLSGISWPREAMPR